MTFVLTVGLIVLGAALLVVGLVASSSWAFLGAAVCSAAAIVLLWKAAGKTGKKTFVTSAPVVVDQDWHQPLIELDGEAERVEITRDELFPVAIHGYGDLVASEIMPSLETLSIEQLEAVILREKQGLGRPIIISRAERLIDLTRGNPDPDLDIRGEHSRTRNGPADGLSI